MYSYPIDFEMFSKDEVVKIIEFLSMIEDLNERVKIDPNKVLKKHKEFRKIINSISLEKQIDRDFKSVSGYSIYQTIKKFTKDLT